VLRVSVLELPARWGERDAALAEVDRLLAAGPTDLAVVPELALTGYVSPRGSFDVRRFAEPAAGPTVERVAELAARHGTAIVAPLVLAEGGALYNAAVLVGPDRRTLAVYRKRHPWYPESWATAAREAPPRVRLGEVIVTFAICFDAQFLADEGEEVLAGADLLVFPSAWVDDEDSRVPLLRTIARRFGIAIANANWGPGIALAPGQGGSCILDGEGSVLAAVEPSRSRRADAAIGPGRR
jgi:predicted amidohydrolase